MLIGGLFSYFILYFFFLEKETNYEDASMMGAQTTSVFSSINGRLIHCQDSRDAHYCIDGAKSRGSKDIILWVGNSQLHAINQWREDEVNSTSLLFEMLKKDSGKQTLDLITFSEPNANLQEHYVLIQYLINRLPLKAIVLPLVYDDTREDGLRNDIAAFVYEKDVESAISKNELGKSVIRQRDALFQESGTSGISDTAQAAVENFITDWLDDNSALWKARPEVRGWIFSELYLFRNLIFGIKPASKRKAIPGRYQRNLAALNEIFFLAKKNGVKIILYIAPIRGDVEIPYVPDEYAKFKLDALNLAQAYSVKLSNLEGLIPPNLWGEKDSTVLKGSGGELDFMHFQGAGHKLLASEIKKLIDESFANPKGGK
jgi:hypothetical protein